MRNLLYRQQKLASLTYSDLAGREREREIREMYTANEQLLNLLAILLSIINYYQ